MNVNERLQSEEQLVSRNGQYQFRLQGDGNLVLRDRRNPRIAVVEQNPWQARHTPDITGRWQPGIKALLGQIGVVQQNLKKDRDSPGAE